MRAYRLLVLAFGSSFSPACSQAELVLVDASSAGTRLVVASLDADARVHGLDWWAGGRTEIEVPAEGSLVGFTLTEDALEDELGLRLETREVSLRRADAPAGDGEGCGRCFARASRAPQVLRPGESCPVPTFAEGRVLFGDAPQDVVELVRTQVWLDGPGACPCSASSEHSPPTLRDLELSPLGDELAAWPIEAWARHSDGRLGLFGEHVAVVTSSLGATLHRREGPSVFASSVVAAAADEDGGFLLYVHEPGAGLYDQVRLRLGADSRELERSESPLSATAAFWLPASNAHLVSGSATGGVRLWLCPPSSPADCVDLSVAGGQDAGTATQLFEEPGGAVFVEQFFRHLLVFDRMPPSGEIVSVDAVDATRGELRGTTGTLARWRVVAHPPELSAQAVSFVAHRELVYACGRLGASGAFVLPLDDPFFSASATSTWTEVPDLRGRACVGGVPVGEEVQLAFADGGSVFCSTSEPGRCRPGPPSPIAGEATAVLSASSEGFELSFSPNRVRTRSNRQTEWTRAYGLPESTSPVHALGVGAELLLVAREDGTLDRHRVADLEPPARDGSWRALTAPPLHAIFVPAEGGFLVSTECVSPDQPELWRLPANSDEVEPVDVPFPGGCRPIERLADLGRGNVLLVERNDELHVFDRGGALRPVSIEWDDPETTTVEGPPALLDFREVSAVAGVVIVVGHGPALLRIDGLHDPERATAISMARETQTNWNPLQIESEPELQALAGRCPDNVHVASRGRQRATFEAGVVWRLAPNESVVPANGLWSVRLLDEPKNAVARRSNSVPSGIRPRAMVGGDADWTVLIMDDSLHRVGASWRIRYVGARTAAVAELPGDRFVLGTSLGDLFLGARVPTE